MKTFKKQLAITITIFFILLFASHTLFAQQANFSGTWQLKTKESISGTLYVNAFADELHLMQNKDEITSGTDTKTTVSETKPFETILPTKEKEELTLKWNEQKNGFTKILKVYDAEDNSKLTYQQTDVYTLNNGELLLGRKAENKVNGESWEAKAVYDKE